MHKGMLCLAETYWMSGDRYVATMCWLIDICTGEGRRNGEM